MNDKVLYLMRGLPSCGKSHTARRIAGESGLVLETDAFFETQGDDGCVRYHYREDRLGEARDHTFKSLASAINQEIGLIVLDRGNGANAETARYVRLAIETRIST